MDNLIPIEKLISRLRTDLKLADNYRAKYCHDNNYGYLGPGPEITRKNQRKASLLFYLEELAKIKNEKV